MFSRALVFDARPVLPDARDLGAVADERRQFEADPIHAAHRLEQRGLELVGGEVATVAPQMRPQDLVGRDWLAG